MPIQSKGATGGGGGINLQFRQRLESIFMC